MRKDDGEVLASGHEKGIIEFTVLRSVRKKRHIRENGSKAIWKAILQALENLTGRRKTLSWFSEDYDLYEKNEENWKSRI